MQSPKELLTAARAILAERWSPDAGWGEPQGPVCLVGALVEPVRGSAGYPGYNTPAAIDDANWPVFVEACEAVIECLPSEARPKHRTATRMDVEDWNDNLTPEDKADVLAVIDCAVSKAAD